MKNLENPESVRGSVDNYYQWIRELVGSSSIAESPTKEGIKSEVERLLRLVVLETTRQEKGVLGDEILQDDNEVYRITTDLIENFWSIVEPAIVEIYQDGEQMYVIDNDILKGSLIQANPNTNPEIGRPIVNRFLDTNLRSLFQEIKSGKNTPRFIKTFVDKKNYWMNALAMLGTSSFTLFLTQRGISNVMENTYLQIENTPWLKTLLESDINRGVVSWGSAAVAAGIMITVANKMQRTLTSEKASKGKKAGWVGAVTLIGALAVGGDLRGSLVLTAQDYHLQSERNRITLGIEPVVDTQNNPVRNYLSQIAGEVRRITEEVSEYPSAEANASARAGKGPIWALKESMNTGSLPAPEVGSFKGEDSLYTTRENAIESSTVPKVAAVHNHLINSGGEYGIDDMYRTLHQAVSGAANQRMDTVQQHLDSLEEADIVDLEATRVKMLEEIERLGRQTSVVDTALQEIARIYMEFNSGVREITKKKAGGNLPFNPNLSISGLDLQSVLDSLNLPVEKLESKDTMAYIRLIQELAPDGGVRDFSIILGRVLAVDIGAFLLLGWTAYRKTRNRRVPVRERVRELNGYRDSFVNHFHTQLNNPILFRTIPGYKGFDEQEIGVMFDEILEEVEPELRRFDSKYQEVGKRKGRFKEGVKKIGRAIIGDDRSDDEMEMGFLNSALKRILDGNNISDFVGQRILEKAGIKGSDLKGLGDQHKEAKAHVKARRDERSEEISLANQREFRHQLKDYRRSLKLQKKTIALVEEELASIEASDQDHSDLEGLISDFRRTIQRSNELLERCSGKDYFITDEDSSEMEELEPSIKGLISQIQNLSQSQSQEVSGILQDFSKNLSSMISTVETSLSNVIEQRLEVEEVTFEYARGLLDTTTEIRQKIQSLEANKWNLEPNFAKNDLVDLEENLRTVLSKKDAINQAFLRKLGQDANS